MNDERNPGLPFRLMELKGEARAIVARLLEAIDAATDARQIGAAFAGAVNEFMDARLSVRR